MGEMKNTNMLQAIIKIQLRQHCLGTLKSTITADVMKMQRQGSGWRRLGHGDLEKRNGVWRLVHWHSSAPVARRLRRRILKQRFFIRRYSAGNVHLVQSGTKPRASFLASSLARSA